jgi:hypothetical protein
VLSLPAAVLILLLLPLPLAPECLEPATRVSRASVSPSESESSPPAAREEAGFPRLAAPPPRAVPVPVPVPVPGAGAGAAGARAAGAVARVLFFRLAAVESVANSISPSVNLLLSPSPHSDRCSCRRASGRALLRIPYWHR